MPIRRQIKSKTTSCGLQERKLGENYGKETRPTSDLLRLFNFFLNCWTKTCRPHSSSNNYYSNVIPQRQVQVQTLWTLRKLTSVGLKIYATETPNWPLQRELGDRKKLGGSLHLVVRRHCVILLVEIFNLRKPCTRTAEQMQNRMTI